jgi:hypothetical protein
MTTETENTELDTGDEELNGLLADEGTAADGADPGEVAAPAKEEDIHAQALEAFKSGVAAAEGVSDIEKIPPLKDAKKEPANDPKKPEVKADAGAVGTGAAASGKAATDQAATAAATTKADDDKQLDSEIKGLGLKGKAEARFREMSTTIREHAPLIEPLAKLGVKSPQQLDEVVQAAARGMEFEQAFTRYSVTPDQFGSALGVIGAMNSGDPKLLNAAFDALLPQIIEIGKKIGREVPGLSDALEEHADLKAAVDEMRIERSAALEIARGRATEKRLADQSARVNEQAQQTQEMTRTQQAAMQEINELNDELAKSDPNFQQKLAMLVDSGVLSLIKDKFPPSKWPGEIAKHYAKLPAPAATQVRQPQAQARVRPSNVPVRGTGTAMQMQQAPKDEREAFLMGVESVTANG